MKGLVVTTEITGAHPQMDDYPLLPGDLLVAEEDGTYFKECPGMAVGGFRLTPEQAATLRSVEFRVAGLNYYYDGGGDDA